MIKPNNLHPMEKGGHNNMKRMVKNVVITTLTLSMIMAGTTAAFADEGHGHGHGHGPKPGDNENFGWGNGKFGGNININLNFSDMRNAEWAMEHIASLASKQVFKGYGDGTFRPLQPVSRIEALTAAVRLLGLESQAQSEMNTQLNFKDANLIDQKYAWAVGYVAVAAEHDLFSTSADKVEPNHPASRLWATTLLVKALNLQDEAEANMNAHLDFKDAKEIPAGSVGYVDVAIKKGLITGYGDKTFKPNKPVTRAELATLLDRTNNQLPGSSQSGNVTGTVVSALSGGKLTVNSNGQTIQLTVNANAYIYSGSTRIQASDIKVGDQITARSVNNQVIFILDQGTNGGTGSAPQQGVYTGTVLAPASNSQLSINSNNQTIQLPLASNAVVVENGGTSTVSSLASGDQIKAYVNNSNLVTYIVVTSSQSSQSSTVEGTITAVSGNQVTLKENNNTSGTWPISSGANLIKNGSSIQSGDLRTGDEVTMVVYNNQITFLQVNQSAIPDTVSGTVVSTANNQLSLSVNNQTMTIALASNATVIRNQQTTTVSALQVGDQVQVHNVNNQAYLIVVTNAAGTFDVTGTINTLTINSQGKVSSVSVTHTVNQGTQNTIYNVSSNVVISGDASLLKQGQSVEVKGSNQEVSQIIIK